MQGTWIRGYVGVCVLALVLTACGQSALPTAAPVPTRPAATPANTAVTSVATTPIPEPEISGSGNPVAGYPPERVKELLAENFYLGGMRYGKEKEPVYGGTAVFPHFTNIPTSDPSYSSSITLQRVNGPITGAGHFARPKWDNVFEPEPFLAKSWEATQDFTVWTFRLREDVKWHDGEPVTAEDFKFWIELSTFPPPGRRVTWVGVWSSLKEVQAIDRYTIRLVLKTPAPHFMETNFYRGVMSHPKHLAEPLVKSKAAVEPADFKWVSVGPYKFDSYAQGSLFKLVRNPFYFEKDAKGRAMPYMDGIDFPIIPDNTVIVSAFRAGRIDTTARSAGYHLLPDQVGLIRKSVGNKAWFTRFTHVAWGISLNALKPPFDDLSLRRAVNLYFNRQEGIRLVTGGYGIPGGVMVPGSYWANPDILTWPGYNPATKAQDQAEAKRLVAASGLAGSKVNLVSRDLYEYLAVFWEAQLRELGLNPSIEIVDGNIETERNVTGNFHAVVRPGGSMLPSQALTAFVTTNPQNGHKHGDTKIDEYDAAIQGALDPKERRRILWEAERYIIVEKAYYPVFWREEAVVAYRTHIKGVWVPGTSINLLNDQTFVWIDNSAR